MVENLAQSNARCDENYDRIVREKLSENSWKLFELVYGKMADDQFLDPLASSRNFTRKKGGFQYRSFNHYYGTINNHIGVSMWKPNKTKYNNENTQT